MNELKYIRGWLGLTIKYAVGIVAGLIEGEMPNMEWPIQQNHDVLALAVPQYIAGFVLFHYAPPKPVRELLHLFFQITEAGFFRSAGFDIPYSDSEGALNKSEITRAIRKIMDQNRAQFPYLKFDPQRLDFGSNVLFSKSYILILKDLNLNKAE